MKKSMRAFRMLRWQEPPSLVEIDLPEPGPGEIRIRVAGNGVCQSDLHMPQLPAIMEQFLGWQMPFTLGHEVGGWIDALGPGVSGFEKDQPVAVVSTVPAVAAIAPTRSTTTGPWRGGPTSFCARCRRWPPDRNPLGFSGGLLYTPRGSAASPHLRG